MAQVLDTFEMPGRGIVVLLDEHPSKLPPGLALEAAVKRPDGSIISADTRPELHQTPTEKAAFLLLGLDRADVPIHSEVIIRAVR